MDKLDFCECDNCDYKLTRADLIDSEPVELGDCPKCGDTLVLWTTETIRFIRQLLREGGRSNG